LTTKQKAYIALGITSTVWGTTWVASRIAVQDTPALEVSAIRQGIAGILFTGFFLIKGASLPNWKQLKWLALMAVLLFVSANGIASMGLKYISSGLGALIAALYPLSVVIIERLFFKNTKITFYTFIGIVLGIAGIVLVFYENAFHHHSVGYIFGIVFSLIAMLSWSIGTILIARNKLNINPYYATGWQMLLGSMMLFILAFVSGDIIPFNQIIAKTWFSISYLVGMGSIFAFVAFIYTMKHLEAPVAALYAYINPIVAILVGSVIVQEPLTINIIIGSAITLMGVYIVNHSLKKQRNALIEPID
jgi:drug/metabolite transporter (DMT)-like permease